MHPRVEGWEERLAALLEERRDQPFAWGLNDCATFACDVIERLVGIDPAWDFRGKYDSARSALRAIAECEIAGLAGPPPRTLEQLAAKLALRHGFEEIPPAFARRGDVLLVDAETETGPEAVLAVVGMDGLTGWAPGPEGLKPFAVQQARCAWRI